MEQLGVAIGAGMLNLIDNYLEVSSKLSIVTPASMRPTIGRQFEILF